jgi:hypothetical protein
MGIWSSAIVIITCDVRNDMGRRGLPRGKVPGYDRYTGNFLLIKPGIKNLR